MKNNSIYWVFGIIILVVLIAMYFVFKSNQTQLPPVNTNQVLPNQRVSKNCTLVYTDWQKALQDLEFAKASGLTMADINNKTVIARNSEIAYNNCLNS